MTTRTQEQSQEPTIEHRVAVLDRAAEAAGPAPRPTGALEWRLLGRSIAAPIGVAASPLTRSAGHVALLAGFGYNVLTFKTMRSLEWKAHPEPNWVYLSQADALPLDTDSTSLVLHGDDRTLPPSRFAVSTANSYGVPSPAPATWQRELSHGAELVGEDRILIASVQGSPEVYPERRALVEDFVKVARLAAETQPAAIELNLSCPNTIDYAGRAARPPLCSSNPALTREIVVEVRDAIPDTPIVAKLSYVPSLFLGALIASFATAVDAIAGINTMPLAVLNRHGDPTFLGVEDDADQAREVAGVSGVALTHFGRDFVRTLTNLRRLNGWQFDILAMGGVMGAEDVDSAMRTGADAVQVATAAVEGPDVATRLAAGVPSMAGI